MRAKLLMMLSVIPSHRYSVSGSRLALPKGSTAIEFAAVAGSAGAVDERAASAAFRPNARFAVRIETVVSGCFSRQWEIKRSSSDGISRRWHRGASRRIDVMVSAAVCPWNARRPETIS
jgi:hypothetical protein